MFKNQLPIKTYKTGKEVVDWKQVEKGFTVEHEDVKIVVVSNENVDKVSGTTGKPYKTRRLVITDVNELVELEVGADSFKKGTFLKRFNKLLSEVKPVTEEPVTVTVTEPVTEEIEEVPVEVVEVVEVVEEVPTEVIEIDLTEEQNDDFDYSKHIMTDSEQTEQQNEFYAILTERGLLQAYSDLQYGKEVDKTIMEKIVGAISDTGDDLDFNEIERMLQEEDKQEQKEVEVKQDEQKQYKKGIATRKDILESQLILQSEPEFIDVKSWSYQA